MIKSLHECSVCFSIMLHRFSTNISISLNNVKVVQSQFMEMLYDFGQFSIQSFMFFNDSILTITFLSILW